MGGLAGYSAYSSITASYATGAVTGDKGVGGLVGESGFVSIVASYATGVVTGDNDAGGIVGTTFNDEVAGHWATDSSGQIEAIGYNGGTTDDSIGATLAELQCPTAASDSTCLTGETLYEGWDAIDHDNDDTTDPINPWIFGDSSTLPTLDMSITIP